MSGLRPCLDCGRLSRASRCPTHQAELLRRRERARARESGGKRNPQQYRVNRRRILDDCTPATPCGICGEPLGRNRRQWTVDHIVARSLDGSHDLENLRPAHRSCNSSRGRGVKS